MSDVDLNWLPPMISFDPDRSVVPQDPRRVSELVNSDRLKDLVSTLGPLVRVPFALFELSADGSNAVTLLRGSGRGNCLLCSVEDKVPPNLSSLCEDLDAKRAIAYLTSTDVQLGHTEVTRCSVGCLSFMVPVMSRRRVVGLVVGGRVLAAHEVAGIEAGIQNLISAPGTNDLPSDSDLQQLKSLQYSLLGHLAEADLCEEPQIRDVRTRCEAVASIIGTLCDAHWDESEAQRADLFLAEVGEKLLDPHVSLDWLWRALWLILRRTCEFFQLPDASLFQTTDERPEALQLRAFAGKSPRVPFVPRNRQQWTLYFQSRSFSTNSADPQQDSLFADVREATGYEQFLAVPLRIEPRTRLLVVFHVPEFKRDTTKWLTALCHGTLAPYITAVLHQEARDSLLHDSFHLLRKPMAMMEDAFLGLDQLLHQLDSTTSVAFQRQVEVIRDGLKFLDLTMDNVLTLTAAAVEPPRLSEPVDLGTVVDDTVKLFQGVAAKRQCAIRWNRSVTGAAVIRADRRRLHLMVANLIDNAVKYSFRHKYVQVILTSTDNGDVTLRIENFGFGILPSEIYHVFEKGYRSHVKDAKRYVAGLGIGLAIVKQVCAELGAHITVESVDCAHLYPNDAEEGEFYKTTFAVSLPGAKKERDAEDAGGVVRGRSGTQP